MELRQMDLAEVRNLVKWIDEQQRKGRQELATLQQQIVTQQREMADMGKRIQELEGQLASAHVQITRLSQVDDQMDQLKTEIVNLIEQQDDRRIRSEKEMERLRQVEHDALTRALTEIRDQVVPVPRLVEGMQQRQAETERLSTAIATVQNQLPSIETRLEERVRDVAFLEEAQRQDVRRIAELQQGLIDGQKRGDDLHAKQLVLEDLQRRNEARLEQLQKSEQARKEQLDQFLEQGRLADQRRKQELVRWADKLTEFEELMAGYARQWRLFDEQNRLSKEATAGLNELKERLEQRQAQMAELQRVESERIKQQWAEFLVEDDKRRKQQQLERELSGKDQQRQREELHGQLQALDERLDKEADNIKSLFALQEKYADNFRQLSRLWLESYETVVKPVVTRKVPG